MTQSAVAGHKRLKPVSPRKPIRQLDSRGERLCELMAFGTDDPEEAARFNVPAHQPLSLKEAAPIAGLRMKNARFLFSETVFMREYSRALTSAKNGHRARAIQRLADLMDNAGDGSAAFASVQLKAANSLLGEHDNRNGASVSVNIQNNSITQLQPGVVIRLPSNVATPPLERMDSEGRIIDAKPIPSTSEKEFLEDRVSIDPDASTNLARNWPHTSGDVE